MSKDSILGKLLKVAGAAAIVYGAYKIGQKSGENKQISRIIDIDSEPIYQNDEEKYVIELLNELNAKKCKTQKDKFNIELLEVKLKQIRNK